MYILYVIFMYVSFYLNLWYSLHIYQTWLNNFLFGMPFYIYIYNFKNLTRFIYKHVCLCVLHNINIIIIVIQMNITIKNI